MTDSVFLPCPTNDVFVAPIQRRKRGRPPLPKRNVPGGGAIAPVKRAPRRPLSTSSDAVVDSDLMSSPHKRRASRRRRAVDPEKELLVVLLRPDLNTREEYVLDIRSDAEYESFLEAMGDDVHSDDEQLQLISPAAANSPVVGLETPGLMRMDSRMGSRDDLMTAGVQMSSYEVFVPAVRDVISADEQKTPLSSTAAEVVAGGGGALVSASDHLMRSSEAARSSSAYTEYMEYDADSDDEAFMEQLQRQQLLYCSTGPSDSNGSSSSSCNPRVELHVVSPSSCSTGDAPPTHAADAGPSPVLLTVQLLERMIALLERHFELSRQFHLDRLDDTIRGSMDDATRIYQLCQQYLVDQQQQQQGSDTRRKRSDPQSNPLLEVCSLLRVTSSNLSPIVINGNSFTSSFSVPIAQSIITSVTSSSSIPSSVSNARRGSRSSSKGIALNNSSNSSTPSSSSRIFHSTRYPGSCITTSRTPLSSIVHPTALEATDSDDVTLTMNAPRRYPVDRISTLLPFEWVRPALRHELYTTSPSNEPDLSVTNRHTAPPIIHTTFSDEQEQWVLKEIYGYWKEKRSRCTTSLVRCFHHYIMDQWRPDDSVALPLPADFSVSSMKTSYIHLQRMRKALDRARLITDRVRRRERLKRDVLRASSDDDEEDGDDDGNKEGDDDEDNSQLELDEDNNGSAGPI